ncbi:hypothetical protein MARA_07860 [Mycolicibacterium arabiense]|uniref:Uncharacterized protein n=1 Tax=Mycolicibacterium arabiense TaxID=1286181 RepID=A0A7I7RRU8_9MYCO|nr:hypothetical protein MARA_07860 [Mycolicibacterium arabiense]
MIELLLGRTTLAGAFDRCTLDEVGSNPGDTIGDVRHGLPPDYILLQLVAKCYNGSAVPARTVGVCVLGAEEHRDEDVRHVRPTVLEQEEVAVEGTVGSGDLLLDAMPGRGELIVGPSRSNSRSAWSSRLGSAVRRGTMSDR